MDADLILERLLTMNLAAAAAIVVLLTLRPALRRLGGARLAYAAWAVAPLAAAATLLPPRIVEAQPAEVAVTAAYEAVVLQAIGATPSPDTLASPAVVLLLVWLGAAALLLAATFWAQARAIRRMGRLAPGPDGIARAPHPDVGPAVVGLLRPRIVVPSDFEARFTAREREVILAHERAHLAGGDTRANTAAAILRCLFWFNPLVHLAVRQARFDQELACDETVIARHPAARRVYGEALLKSQLAITPLPFGCYWPSRSAGRLKERIVMLTRERPGPGRRRAGAAMVGLLGAATGFAAWACAPPQTVIAAAPEPAPTQSRAAPAMVSAPADETPVEVRRAVVQAAVDSRLAPTPTLAPQVAPSAPATAVADPAPDPAAERPPASVQLLNRGGDLVLFTCEPAGDPGRVTCAAVPQGAHGDMARRALERAQQTYRVALLKAPTPTPPVRVSCYWPSKAAVRKPWTDTPDWRCQAPTHQSVTAALARRMPQDARLLSYTCRPAERSGLRSCSATIAIGADGPRPRQDIYALTIGGTPLADPSDAQRMELAAY